MAQPICTVICVLNTAIKGHGAAAIHASARGLRITLNGKTLCKGKTPGELHANFTAAVEKAKRT